MYRYVVILMHFSHPYLYRGFFENPLTVTQSSRLVAIFVDDKRTFDSGAFCICFVAK